MRRLLAALAVSLVALLGAPAATSAQTADENVAVAVNTEDGASVFRLAMSVRFVADGVVDQTNAAIALASCTDCQTVALAFQVVLVRGDADVVVPENQAVAYNDQCVECVTYASATQIVLGFDGHVRLSGEGRRRLVALHRALRDLEGQVGELTVAQLNAAVQAAKVELVDILNTELVEWETGQPATTTTSSSTTSTTVDGTTTTTAEEDTATTTTTAEESTSTTEPETTTTSTTTSTTAPDSTTTTAAP